MLMQLVCVDRRYQRMNCFNIRELQGVLKRKFFTDLVNTNDHRDFLNQSMIGLRFKTNNQLSITPDVESFFNLGTTNNTKSKSLSFTNSYEYATTLFQSNALNLSFDFLRINVITNSLQSLFTNFLSLVMSINVHSVFTYTYSFSAVSNVLNSNFTLVNSALFYNTVSQTSTHSKQANNVTFSTENTLTLEHSSHYNKLLSETSNNVRFTRFNNPLISYDYKCGHYLGI
jgi:hypothetical protein